jgi:hypothetical protein
MRLSQRPLPGRETDGAGVLPASAVLREDVGQSRVADLEGGQASSHSQIATDGGPGKNAVHCAFDFADDSRVAGVQRHDEGCGAARQHGDAPVP